MTYSKKLMSIAVLSLLILSTGILMPVKAEVDVTVTTTEDVCVSINADGSVTIYYNGVKLLEEINNLKAGLQSLSSAMTYLATETDVTELNQTINQLIEELDVVFTDVYSRTNYLASIIGITDNSTEVSLNLVNGTHTVASYLEGLVDNLNETNTQLAIIYNEFQNLEASTSQVVNTTYVELSEQRETLRQDVLADLLTLESLLQNKSTQLAITEKKLSEVEQRFDDYVTAKAAESQRLNSVLIVAALATTLTIVTIAAIKKKNGSTAEA